MNILFYCKLRDTTSDPVPFRDLDRRHVVEMIDIASTNNISDGNVMMNIRDENTLVLQIENYKGTAD